MSRKPEQILQVPSPTDGSLKSFVSELLKNRIIVSAVVTVGGQNAQKIEGTLDTVDANDEVGSQENLVGRDWEKVCKDIEAVFASTSALGFSIKKISFHSNEKRFCEFERCRTTTEVVTNSNRSSEVRFVSVPDARVAEFNYISDDAAVGEFNSVMNKILRPNPAAPTTDIGPIGIDDVLSKMAGVSAGLMNDLANAQLQQSERMDDLLAKQSEDYENQQIKLQEEHSARLAELDQRSAELDEREEKLDNDTARSTRRGLRKQITADIKSNLEREIIPDSAQRLRWPIYFITFIGIIGSLAFSYMSFSEIGSLPENLEGTALNWYVTSLLIRGSLGILAASAIGLYVIKYLRNLESEAGRRALLLEQNLFDIDRASWVIETVMELKEEEGMSSVPGPWLQGATHGLFNREGAKSEESGPVDALVDLMGTGMSMKVSNGKIEASFDSKASKDAAKKQKKSEDETN